jgi:anti-sigma factor (TIGR02949 family)
MSTDASRDAAPTTVDPTVGTTDQQGGKPSDVQCEHVLARVYEFLDHEVDTATGDEIRAHLSECEPCLDRFDVEQAVKSLVKRCCGNDKAPDRLRTSIMSSLSVTRRSL